MKKRSGLIISQDVYNNLNRFKNQECKTMIGAATYLIGKAIFQKKLDEVNKNRINERLNKRYDIRFNPKIDAMISDKNYEAIKSVADNYGCKPCHVIECLMETILKEKYDQVNLTQQDARFTL